MKITRSSVVKEEVGPPPPESGIKPRLNVRTLANPTLKREFLTRRIKKEEGEEIGREANATSNLSIGNTHPKGGASPVPRRGISMGKRTTAAKNEYVPRGIFFFGNQTLRPKNEGGRNGKEWAKDTTHFY